MMYCYSRFHKKCNDLRINYRGEGDFMATFEVNNTPVTGPNVAF